MALSLLPGSTVRFLLRDDEDDDEEVDGHGGIGGSGRWPRAATVMATAALGKISPPRWQEEEEGNGGTGVSRGSGAPFLSRPWSQGAGEGGEGPAASMATAATDRKSVV